MAVDVRTWPRWGVAAVLALPFVVTAWLLDGLTTAMPTFHGSDETLYHLPAIERFVREWPTPDLLHYPSATAPLFHLLFALIAKVTGFGLAGLRACAVLVSYLATLAVYRLWRDRFREDRGVALVLTFVFLLSPYFFGASFLLLTDGLGWLWCLLAIHAVLLAVERRSLVAWAGASTAMCAAFLTRQSLVWLVLAAVPFVFRAFSSTKERVAALSMLVASGLPLAALVVLWGGLTPPAFQGLHEARSAVHLRALEFTLAVAGLYAPLWAPDAFVEAVRKRDRWFLGALLAGASLLVAFPVGTGVGEDGLLWRVAHRLPAIHDTSVVFWLLVPVGAAAVVRVVRTAPTSFGTAALVAFTVTLFASERLYQKYLDPFVPLFLLLTRTPAQGLTRRARVVILATCVVFVAYALLPVFGATFASSPPAD